MNGKKSGGGPEPNRLIHEPSPYLRQHALNPVDWLPWSPEAFSRAAREDKPVFLSIGYSTCHWCHVMERESFEDPETAALMNRVFVSIKVDREERPDIDAVYMEVCRALTGSGGWPLTLFLTPDRKPFFAATYLPRTSRFGRPGLRELIPRIESFWKDRRGDLLNSADEITAALRRPDGSGVSPELGEPPRRSAFRRLSESFDPRHGGFSPAPKFPMPSHLGFLLRYAHRTGDRGALDMVETTLAAMRGGGVYDQLGYGFHRYSTDREWRLPHFEKMLYDQALMVMVYVEAFQVTGRPLYRSTAEEILGYVLRDMTSSEGGFFTAEDADSEGEEGRFYTWEMEEVRDALSREDFEEAKRLYDLRPEGNFREEAGSGPTGRNILMPGAAALEAPGREAEKRRARIRRRLFEIREKRERPFLDRTVLTDWNGLMIAALARAGRALDSPEYTSAASRAAEFLLDRSRRNGTRLLHRHDETGSAVPGFAADYAFLAWGLVELFQADFRPARLTAALGLMECLLERFWDAGNGGFFQTSEDAEDLLLRPREFADGAVPSPNSAALDVLLRLGRLTGKTDLEERAGALIRAASGPVSRHPAAFTHFLQGLDFSLDPTREIVIAGRRDAPDTRALLEVAARRFLPDSVVLLLPEEREDPDITGPAPFTSGLPRVSGPARAFICRDFSCRRPISDPAEFEAALETGSGPAPDNSKST